MQADLRRGRRLLQLAMVRWPSPEEADSIGERFVAMGATCRAVDTPPTAFADQLKVLAELADWAVAQLAKGPAAAD